jgi:hypothetical protein
MSSPDPDAPHHASNVAADGPVCVQSSLSPQVRIAITFGVLFALKWLLPLAGVAPTVQVLVLVAAATFFAWRFWWRCGTDRRGPLLLIGTLWIAGLAKVLLAP